MTTATPGSASDGSVTRYRHRRSLVWVGVAALLTVLAFVLNVAIGSGPYSLGDVVGALLVLGDAPRVLRVVVWDIRLPTALISA